MSTDKLRADALEQLAWGARSLPVKLRSRVYPAATARALAGQRRIHLGCGSNLLEEWANLDVGGQASVIAFDLLRPLPVSDGAVDRVFTEHFIEHVTRVEARRILRDCARALAPGGVLRISTPDLATLVREYLAGRTTEWHDVDWRPATPGALMNEGMRLWGHKYLWDEADLTAELLAAGYSTVERVTWHQSRHSDLRGLECRPAHDDLILEATR